MRMVWSRESAAVLPESPERTSGRIPAKTLRTSPRDRLLCQIERCGLRMNSISCSSATGSSVASGMGVSVVPTSVWPCQGMANITRPSLVCGTMMALSPARNEPSNTRWIPWLGAIIGWTEGSALRRKSSAERAGGVDRPPSPGRSNSSPVSTSRNRHAVHEALAILGQFGDLRVVQQDGALLVSGRTRLMSSRESSNWPSK